MYNPYIFVIDVFYPILLLSLNPFLDPDLKLICLFLVMPLRSHINQSSEAFIAFLKRFLSINNYLKVQS